MRSEEYRRHGWVALREVIDHDFARFLSRALIMMGETDRLSGDVFVDASLSTYGDPMFETLLEALAPTVSELVGAEVAPTYSFARLYFEGGELVRHTDRPACEHSLSLHLGREDPDSPWDLCVEGEDGAPASVAQRPGDALLYRGVQRPHWRAPLDQLWGAQVFLHYVAVDGPFARCRFDERERLGLPPVERRVDAEPPADPSDAAPAPSDGGGHEAEARPPTRVDGRVMS